MSFLRPGERDRPENRGHGWEKCAEKMKERDNHTCQSCGAQFTEVEVHHIVKGKHLPMINARAWLNLITLCPDCHTDLEGLPPLHQFRRLAQHDGQWGDYRADVADILELLRSGWTRKKEMRERLGVKKDRLDVIMNNLVAMGCAIKSDDSRYRAPVAAACRAELEHTKQDVEMLENKLGREEGLREQREERIEELEAELEENDRHLQNAIASLETAVMELKADRPVLRQVRSDVREGKSLLENTQESDEPEKTREERVAEAMEELA